MFVSFFIQKLGRSGAFNLSTAGWIPCGLLLLGTGARAGEAWGVEACACACKRVLPWSAQAVPCKAATHPRMHRGFVLVVPKPQCSAACAAAHPSRSARLPPPPALPSPAAFTLARDEDAMQHRLRKVLSSYTFSSSTLNQLDEDEDGEVAEHEYTQRPLAAAATAADAFPSQHEQQQLGVVQLPLTAVEAALAKPLGDGRDDGGSVAGRPAPP